MDSFQANIEGVRQLVELPINKVQENPLPEEGITGEQLDPLVLDMEDSELIQLSKEWENISAPYHSKIEPRQKRNKTYYKGLQREGMTGDSTPVADNVIFESEETFIPQALSKNPEPVVWSDNTEEGKIASNDLKTTLQFQADQQVLRKKLGIALRHWSINFIGILKHGWNSKYDDICTEVRHPKNFVFDPEAYIDESGDYQGAYLGERIPSTGKDLIDLYPDFAEVITLKLSGKLGTKVTRTEWWTNEYMFVRYEDIILEKTRNPFFNYGQTIVVDGVEETVEGNNHFATPKMPYTFLSVISLQEQPFDETNLIEQNIANQDNITNRETQIQKNLKVGNNSLAVSGQSFDIETARLAAKAIEDGDPVLVPSGDIGSSIQRLPANSIPEAVFRAQQNAKDSLRSVFGVQGISSTATNDQSTARGMILEKQYDSTRIGGGVGDALEQVADNTFNWWTQLMYVFYDEKRYAAIMGSGRAVEYVGIILANTNRRFVVSVVANSMSPKDEISEQNQAIDLANSGWLDPINLFKKLNYPDPMETARMVTMYRVSPELYLQTFFPENAVQLGTPPSPLPTDQIQNQTSEDTSLSANQANPNLSQVPIKTSGMPT